MRYNVYLFGTDVNNLHAYALELLKITKFTEVISFYDIHKTMNSSKPSKHFLSKSLFFEDIENKIYTNNIIIPNQVYDSAEIDDLASIAIDDGKNMRKNSIVCIIKNSWSEMEKNKNKLLQFHKKNKIYKANVDVFTNKSFFEYTQKKLEGIMISGLTHKIYSNTDIMDGVISFTEYCLNNKLDDVLMTGE